MSTTNDLLSQVLALPEQQRAEMARQILISLEPQGSEVDHEAAWLAEIEARLDAIDRGDAVLYDAREALEDIRKQLQRRQPENADSDAEEAWADEIMARSDTIHRGDYKAREWREAIEDIRRNLSRGGNGA